MKYIIVLLLGFALGVLGEFIIPTKFQYPIGKGCLHNINNPTKVFLPGIDIYEPGYGRLTLVTDESIPSYSVLKDFLIGDLSRLDRETCNAVIHEGAK